MGIPNVTVSFLPVLVAVIAQMIIGGFWYSPAGFGKQWMKLSGMTKKQLAKAKKKGMGKSYLLAFIGSLMTAYVLAHFVVYVTAQTLSDGIQLGFWLWLGFVAPITLGMVLWEGKSWKLWILNNTHNLISLIVMAGILSVWN
ncbi:MAG TPA: DUF1761 domain-containing protein [Candidatus Nanoarchaeia archaeon]|nr:DUF1761 domain-containing protein [Candidatus Nanoarchaeia archaeon]